MYAGCIQRYSDLFGTRTGKSAQISPGIKVGISCIYIIYIYIISQEREREVEILIGELTSEHWLLCILGETCNEWTC